MAADRITTWKPGILSDDQLGQVLGSDGLPQRTTVCAALNPGGDIQAAIDACHEGQVVELNPGTFAVSSTITLSKGVVLRGAGSQGAPTGTTIVKTGGETVLAIGDGRDAPCYGGTGYALEQDAPKESATLSIGAAAGNFATGDLALVDVVDDSTIRQGDCDYFKRVSGRSASQRVEIKSVDGAKGMLTLGSPLHWSFKSASPSFPHMELMEGNYAPHMGASITHGNAGYLTYFRNYASSQFAPPAVFGSTASQTGNVTALEFDAGDLGMNVLGNVLGADGVSTAYDGDSFSIYELGAGGSGDTDVAITSLFRHGNFDYVHKQTIWDPATNVKTLPASAYLDAKPTWWPAGTSWPWVGPDLTPMIGVLPAKARSDSMPP